MFWFGSGRGSRVIFLFPLFWILLASSHGWGHPGMWWIWVVPFWIIPSVMRSRARSHRPRTTVPLAAPPVAKLPQPPPGDLRVGDAERDRATAALREHLMAGRLTSDEFDERIATTLRARTWDDLRDVTRDLPGRI